MFKLFVKPILFLFDPERIHHIIVAVLKFARYIPGKMPIIKLIYSVNNPKLERKLFGLTFKNPVGLAAGFDKNASIFNELACFGFGFIEIGSVTPKMQEGNPKKRLFRIVQDNAIINRMGINNLGVNEIVKNLKKRRTDIIIGGNMGKNTATSNENAIDDYFINFKTLHPYVDYFVINVSCPNIGNLSKLQDEDFIIDLLKILEPYNEKQTKVKPILLKISPDLNDKQLDGIIKLVNSTSLSGVVATNTTTSRDNLTITEDKINAIGNGGLSGKPLKDKSTSVIKYLADKSNKSFPIIGVGGIMSAEDAIEKLNAGADLIQIYTGFIYQGPSLIKKINKKILETKL